ncbi:hypothetical protein E2C01_070189 [Portunus trituberculatus]|uniref:Uncharacterized protein n=1 Tax=Portunus trituberculatus TaxID=210409 RepID=A0A5B7I0N2_PORTR|nr:hypothetical protein [Portunus trituberculatus]
MSMKEKKKTRFVEEMSSDALYLIVREDCALLAMTGSEEVRRVWSGRRWQLEGGGHGCIGQAEREGMIQPGVVAAGEDVRPVISQREMTLHLH